MKLEACISLCLILSLLLSLISFLFHSPCKAAFLFFTQPALVTMLEFSSAFRLLAGESCSSSQHSLSQMGAEGRIKSNMTTQQKLFYSWLSEQVFNSLPTKFISSTKRLVYLLVKETLTVSTCKIERCVTEFLIKSVFQLILRRWQSKSDWCF